MFKKIISFGLIVMMALNLMACGSSSDNKTASKNGVDYIFYQKDGATYYTNDNGKSEKKLSDTKANAHLAEDLNCIIYAEKKEDNNFKLYCKKIDSEEEATLISDNAGYYTDGGLIKNKVLFYRENKTYYIYNVETKEKIKINDDTESEIKSILYSYKKGVICYIDLSLKDGRTLTASLYNVITKEKKQTVLSNNPYDMSAWAIGIGDESVIYIYTIMDQRGKYQKTNLYKVIPGMDPVLIDTVEDTNASLDVAVDGMSSYYAYKCFDGLKVAGDNLFYFKHERKETAYGEKMFTNLYYYDGNEKHLIKDEELHLPPNSSIFTWNQENEDHVAGGHFYIQDETGLRGYGEQYDEFFVGDKKYQGELKGISNDKHLVYYNKDDKSYIMSVKDGAVKELNNSIDKIIWTNDNIVDHLLYMTSNKDLVFDDNIIATSVGDKNYDYSPDLSIILFKTNDGMSIYKDGKVTNITKTDSAAVTNNSNAYYLEDGKLYLYKNNKPELVAENVSGIVSYYICN